MTSEEKFRFYVDLVILDPTQATKYLEMNQDDLLFRRLAKVHHSITTGLAEGAALKKFIRNTAPLN